jgi:hypothetical protein
MLSIREKSMTSNSKRIALAGLAVGLLLSCSLAMAAIDPVPGVDIIVKKNPGPIVATVPTEKSGKFSMEVKESGDYTVSTSCRGLPCAAGQHIKQLKRAGKPLKPGADGSYSFSVAKSGVVIISGTVPGISDQGAAGGLTSYKNAKEKGGGPINPGPPPAISTSRSNIKKPGVAAAPPPGDFDGDGPGASATNTGNTGAATATSARPKESGTGPTDPGPPPAPVSTTRSNKKAGVAKEGGGPGSDLPSAPINTSRSNKKAGKNAKIKITDNESPRPLDRLETVDRPEKTERPEAPEKADPHP